MLPPAHLDGCSVVVLRRLGGRFQVVEHGLLAFDGETLTLGDGASCRAFTDDEREWLRLVTENSRIRECRGFRFFLLADADA